MSAERTSTPPTLFLLDERKRDIIYSHEIQRRIHDRVSVLSPFLTSETWREATPEQREAKIIFSGWGMPKADEEFLGTFPQLKAIFYGAGSIRGFETPALWDRGILVTGAAIANAVPVAEFSLSQILFCLKHGWHYASLSKASELRSQKTPPPGNYGSTVGLLSLGMIGRMVAEHLQRFDHRVLAYDPLIDQEQASELGVEMVSLEEVFAQSDVVSCHMPWLPETENVLRKSHFSSMKQGATFINTGRGAVVNEHELCDVLARRLDLLALLDVTHPEPPEPGSRLLTLPNVNVTQHIAGSIDRECQRMGLTMLQELEKYLAGQPLDYQITREQAALRA